MCRIASMAAVVATLAACGLAPIPTPQTDVGITDDGILLGSTNAQSGPASTYATVSDAEHVGEIGVAPAPPLPSASSAPHDAAPIVPPPDTLAGDSDEPPDLPAPGD